MQATDENERNMAAVVSFPKMQCEITADVRATIESRT